jgi:hypothetical protein
MDELVAQCHFRAERQTFIPVLDPQGRPRSQAVFTIRVMMEPLAAAVRTPRDARMLHDSLASMSDTVQAYKHVAPVRERLLRWLAARAAATV